MLLEKLARNLEFKNSIAWQPTNENTQYWSFNSCGYFGYLSETNSISRTLKMIFPPPQVVFGLLLLSIAVVLIWDIRYSPFGEDEDGI